MVATLLVLTLVGGGVGYAVYLAESPLDPPILCCLCWNPAPVKPDSTK
jgi:hypothetical protein